jgi:hypothetical protein
MLNIPSLPALKTIFLFTDLSSKDRKAAHKPISLPTAPAGTSLHPIPHEFVRQLSLAPELLAIRFTGSPHQEGGAPSAYDRVQHSVPKWELYQASGILIRTYENKLNDSLVLLRARVRGLWIWYADFNGRPVKRERLIVAMSKISERFDWDQPGRKLHLSEEGWGLLRG